MHSLRLRPYDPLLHCPDVSIHHPALNTGILWLFIPLLLDPLYRAVILHLAFTAQQLPSFPHAGLHVAQLFVGLVEDFQLVATPAPPDTQAPLHIFLMKATYNCVFCH